MSGKVDNTGHEVIDLPRSAYHEVPAYLLGAPSLFDVPPEPWSTHAYLLGLRWRLDVQAAHQVDPRMVVRLTGC